ncbi:hypothetical protein QQ045_000833 [Rhodiola kirilowii]
MCHDSHFYMVACDMTQAKIEVVDNSKKIPSFKKKYGIHIDNLMKKFSNYLIEIKHKKCAIFEDVKPKRLAMSWRTKNNDTDCGILMRHMEYHNGSDCKNWDCGLTEEGEKMATSSTVGAA